MGLPLRHPDSLYTGNVFGELVNLIEKTQMSMFLWCLYLEGNKINLWGLILETIPINIHITVY